MKLKGVLLTTALTAMLGVGVFAGVSNNRSEPVEKAEATGTKRVYIDFNGVGFSSNAYLYPYGGTGTPKWPGTHLNTSNKIDKSSIILSSRNALARDIYYWDISDDHTTAIVCNSNGADVWNRWNGFNVSSYNLFQSTDWGVGGGDESTVSNYNSYSIYKITLNKANSTSSTEYHIPAWSDNGYSAPTPTSGYRWVNQSTSQPFTNQTVLTGDLVLSEVAVPQYTVKFYLDDKSTLYDSVVVDEGSTASCSKSNPTKAQEGGKQYSFAGWVNNDGTAATLTNITADKNVYASFSSSYVAGRYIVGKSNDWSIGSATYMTPNGNESSGQITLAYGDEIKIPYYDGTDIVWDPSIDSYNAVTPNAAAYHYFGDGTNHNIKCYAAGTYTFYFTESNYDETYKISVAYNGALTAQHLAAQLMGADLSQSAPDCKDSSKFPAMKTIFLGLSSAEQTTFKNYATSEEDQFKNAYDRYVAWAAACGQKPWEAGAVSGAASLPFNTSVNNTASTTSAILIAVAAAVAIGGFILLKKKKIK